MVVSLTRRNLDLAKNIILLDGFSSSGKSLMGPILSHLSRAEFWQIDYFYEQISVLGYLHKIPFNSLKAIVETRSDETIYNLFIGRNVNFRRSDESSPFYNKLEKKYLKRLYKKDKIYALREISKKNPYLICNIHFIFGYSKFLLDAFENRLSMYVLMLRDPFYLIDRWHQGNWPFRRVKDSLDFGLCIKVKNRIIPWYAKEYAAKYIGANSFEKSILTVYEYYKHVFKMFKNLNQKKNKKMQLIFFEDFVNYPEKYIDKISKKLSFNKQKQFKKIAIKLIPKKKYNQITTYDFFNKKFSRIISPEYKKTLIRLNKLYLDFFTKNTLPFNR